MSAHFRQDGTQRGSLPLALLVVIIVAGIVVVLVSRTVTSQRQVQFDQSFHGALPVADAGVETSKFRLNANMDLQSADDNQWKPARMFDVDESTVEDEETIDGRTYRWTMTRRAGFWEVDSTATDDRGRNAVTRRINATMLESPFVPVAAFADLRFSLSGSNTADSYSSRPEGQWCTGQGLVASNGVVSFSGVASPGPCAYQRPAGRTVDHVVLYGWDEGDVDGITPTLPGGERCGSQTGNPNAMPPNVNPDNANCKEVSQDSYVFRAPLLDPDEMTPSIDNAKAFITDALAQCPDQLDDYRASMDGETLEPATSGPTLEEIGVEFGLSANYYCYENLLLDTDTLIHAHASTNDPVVIFVNGDLRIAGGSNNNQAVSIGCEGGCTPGVSRPEAGRLWIFVNGGDVGVRAQSDFAGVIWAPESDCGGIGPGGPGANAQVDFYGALICGSIPANQGGWRFHYDEGLGDVGDGNYTIESWEELSAD